MKSSIIITYHVNTHSGFTSVTSMILMAANWPVFTCRPYTIQEINSVTLNIAHHVVLHTYESETLTNVHAISPHTPGQVTTNRKPSHKSPLIVRNIQTKLTVHSTALRRAHLVNLTVCAITHHFNELKYASWILRRKEVCTTIYRAFYNRAMCVGVCMY